PRTWYIRVCCRPSRWRSEQKHPAGRSSRSREGPPSAREAGQLVNCSAFRRSGSPVEGIETATGHRQERLDDASAPEGRRSPRPSTGVLAELGGGAVEVAGQSA